MLARAALFLFCSAAAPDIAAAAGQFDLPQGPGRELVYGNCQTCHDLQSVLDSAGIRRGAWDAVLDNMKEFGLRITDDQRTRILDYLGTYLGPNPPAAAEATASASVATADGEVVFSDTCAACHQEGGVGKEGEFPPLAANPDLFLSETFPVYVVLNGIEGKLTVNGAEYDNAMPSFDFLSDDEIAAVLAYVRASWGNADLRPAQISDPDAAAVGTIRGDPMDPDAVAEKRMSLKE